LRGGRLEDLRPGIELSWCEALGHKYSINRLFILGSHGNQQSGTTFVWMAVLVYFLSRKLMDLMEDTECECVFFFISVVLFEFITRGGRFNDSLSARVTRSKCLCDEKVFSSVFI
jgi:hypothetical protein